MTKTSPTNWLAFAKDDLTAAHVLMARELFHLTCFHAQQAVEKTLKACIIHHEATAPKTHALLELYERLVSRVPEIHKYRGGLEALDQYYIPTRYPDALPGFLPEGLPNKKDAEEAISIASELLALVREHI